MNREQLRAQGLTEEQIDAVMADHGRVVQGMQTRLTTAETRTTELEQQLEQASNSDEVQMLTQRAEEAEAQSATLQGQLDQISIDNMVNTALTNAGATDLDYARFKLGEVALSEDGKSIVDLDNKLKDLQEQIPTYFQVKDDKDQNQAGAGGTGGNQNDLNNFNRIPAVPGNGKQSAPDDAQAMIAAMTSDIPAPSNK